MAEYIEKEEFFNVEKLLDTDIVRRSKTASWLMDQLLHDIKASPAADVAPVVRCKDCEFYFETHNEMDETLCLNRQWDNGQPWRAIVQPMDFCSYGERKVNTHELP